MLEPEQVIELRRFFSSLASICGLSANQNALPYIEEILKEEALMREHMRHAIREMDALLQRVSPPEELAETQKH